MSILATSQLSLLDDLPAPWAVRRSTRARRLSVRVFRDARVEVVAPVRASVTSIESFLTAHREWIERRRRAFLQDGPAPTPFPPAVLELEGIGETWRVHLAGGPGRLRAIASAGSGVLQVQGGIPPGEAGKLELQRALRDWLLRRGRAALAPLLTEQSRSTGLIYQRISLRSQRTRWGSCSSRGTISLNLALLFQSPEAVRYLMIHELAHTRHMNHSALFWALVAQHCPQWRRLDRQLLDGWRRVPSWLFR